MGLFLKFNREKEKEIKEKIKEKIKNLNDDVNWKTSHKGHIIPNSDVLKSFGKNFNDVLRLKLDKINFGITQSAVFIFQWVIESEIIDFLVLVNLQARHAKRVTIFDRDVLIVTQNRLSCSSHIYLNDETALMIGNVVKKNIIAKKSPAKKSPTKKSSVSKSPQRRNKSLGEALQKSMSEKGHKIK